MTRKLVKLEYKILFGDELELGSCSKKKMSKLELLILGSFATIYIYIYILTSVHLNANSSTKVHGSMAFKAFVCLVIFWFIQ